jgi:hypothetical protein
VVFNGILSPYYSTAFSRLQPPFRDKIMPADRVLPTDGAGLNTLAD